MMPNYEKLLASTRPPLSPAILRDLLTSRTPFCSYCFVELTEENRTLDHLQPRSQGGLRVAGNSVIACLRCNLTKGSRTPQQWSEDILDATRWRLEDLRHVYRSSRNINARCLFCERPRHTNTEDGICIVRIESLRVLYSSQRKSHNA